jgi:hypothetical protein
MVGTGRFELPTPRTPSGHASLHEKLLETGSRFLRGFHQEHARDSASRRTEHFRAKLSGLRETVTAVFGKKASDRLTKELRLKTGLSYRTAGLSKPMGTAISQMTAKVIPMSAQFRRSSLPTANSSFKYSRLWLGKWVLTLPAIIACSLVSPAQVSAVPDPLAEFTASGCGSRHTFQNVQAERLSEAFCPGKRAQKKLLFAVLWSLGFSAKGMRQKGEEKNLAEKEYSP